MNRKLSSMLSLCQKAGRLQTGELACEKALQKGEAELVIVCKDASDNTKKKFSQKAFFYEVPYVNAFTKAELGVAIGRTNRATIAIIDKGFACKILELVSNDSEELKGLKIKENVSEQKSEVYTCPK